MEIELNTSWLYGKYKLNGQRFTNKVDVEIHPLYTALGEWFCQGEESDNVQSEILAIWNKEDCTQQQAIERYIDRMGIEID